MYYLLIIFSVILFGGNFALNDIYRKMRGSSIKISLQFNFLSSVAGFIALVVINGFKLEFTPFSLVMAILTALNGFGFTYCGFKALNRINLSMYSLFSMLGGMAVPFVQGIVFYGEKLTLAKGVCFVIITASLLMTIEKGEKKKGTIFYIGIFVLNGMSGVLSKIFTEAPFEKVSAAGYSILSSVCSIVLSAVFLILLFKNKDDAPKSTFASVSVGAISGILNKIANFILVFALIHVEASVQYPMVTGGVMIVSTAICFFGDRKPSKKEIFSVLVAFVGMIALFAIPI